MVHVTPSQKAPRLLDPASLVTIQPTKWQLNSDNLGFLILCLNIIRAAGALPNPEIFSVELWLSWLEYY